MNVRAAAVATAAAAALDSRHRANPAASIGVKLGTRVKQEITGACQKGDFMTKITTALLALAMSVPAVAVAQMQDNSAQSGMQDSAKAAQQQANQAAEENENGSSTQPIHKMMGMVSNNGMTFTSDNTAYQVSNPDKLKGYDNQTVTVEYQYSPDRNKIKIHKVNAGQ